MKTLHFALPMVVVAAWLAGSGCDDNRPVSDLPVGGEGLGGPAGGGEPPVSGDSGGADSPGSAGQGGAQGGASAASECPADLFSAEGEDCGAFAEGFTCSDGGTDPCEFGNSIVCTGGVWERREAFPAPCGGASAGGATGQGGEATTAGAGGA